MGRSRCVLIFEIRIFERLENELTDYVLSGKDNHGSEQQIVDIAKKSSGINANIQIEKMKTVP